MKIILTKQDALLALKRRALGEEKTPAMVTREALRMLDTKLKFLSDVSREYDVRRPPKKGKKNDK